MVKRLFVIISGFIFIFALVLFALYGSIQFWDHHVLKWLEKSTSDIIGISCLSVIVLWIFLILKYVKEEWPDIDKT